MSFNWFASPDDQYAAPPPDPAYSPPPQQPSFDWSQFNPVQAVDWNSVLPAVTPPPQQQDNFNWFGAPDTYTPPQNYQSDYDPFAQWNVPQQQVPAVQTQNPYLDLGKAFSQFDQAVNAPAPTTNLLDYARNNNFAGGIAQGNHALPQGDYNPLDWAGSWLANLGQGFTKGAEQAIGEAQQQNQTEQFAPWQLWNALSSGVKGAAQGTVGAMGEAFKPLGGGIDTAAQSGIPGVSQIAQGVRAGYVGTLEPVFNFLPSVLGSEAGSVQSWNPFDFRTNSDWFRQQYAQHDADTMYQDAYSKALSEGKPENVARDEASVARLKGFLPWTRAEQGGVQKFGEFPAVAQLATMFADPFARAASRYTVDPAAAYAMKGAGKLADVTGVTDTMSRIGEKLQSPQAMQADFTRQTGLLNSIVEDIKAGGDDRTPYEILSDVVENPDSPYASFASQLPDEVKQTALDVLEHTRQTERLQDLKDSPQTPQGQLAVESRDTGAGTGERLGPEETPAPWDEARSEEPPTQADKNFASIQSATKELFPSETRELPDHMQFVKAPSKTGDLSEFTDAMNQAYGLKVKALKVTGESGKPQVVATRPLEQFGAPGRALTKFSDLTMGPLSRLYLNSMGRAIRDPLGNVMKLVMENIPMTGAKQVNLRYERIFGGYTPELGGGLLHDTGKGGTTTGAGRGAAGKPESALKTLAYTLLAPQNELPSMALRRLSRGKFQNFNDFAEKAETGIKSYVYKREVLKNLDAAVDRAVSEGRLAPHLKEAIKAGSLTPDMLSEFVKGRMPPGADLGQAIRGEYNPMNFSPEVMKLVDKSLGGSGSAFGNTLSDMVMSLPDRVKEWNRTKQGALEAYTARMRNPKNKRLQERTYQANHPQIKLEDITPDHPIFKQLEQELNNAWDTHYKAHVTQEAVDPKTQQAAKDSLREALVYAAKDKNLVTLKRKIATEQARSEGWYKTNFGQKAELPTPAPAKGSPFIPKRFAENMKKAHPEYTAKDIAERWADRGKSKTEPLPEAPPATENIFANATDAKGIAAKLKELEKFKSDKSYEEGGEALTVAHQKQVADAIASGDRARFDEVVSQISKDKRYREGITGEGVHRSTRFSNADRLKNRLEYYWDKWGERNGKAANQTATDRGIGERSVVPESGTEGAAIGDRHLETNGPDSTVPGGGNDAGRLSDYYDRIYGYKVPDNVWLPDTLQRLAAKFDKVTPEQRARYFQNFMDADSNIREVTGNTFRLDPDTLHPVRIEDGAYLRELVGKGMPERVGAPMPKIPEGVDVTDFANLFKAMTDYMGPKAGDYFRLMDPAGVDQTIADLAKMAKWPDPTDPHPVRQRLDMEREAAEKHLDLIKKDMRDRYQAKKDQDQKAQDILNQRDAEAELNKYNSEQMARDILSTRASMMQEAHNAAYKRVSDIYFDYTNKNVLDQALGSILPFNFWARHNFLYITKYLASHPYQAAALVHFYQQLEKENSDQNVPGYARGNLLLWKNPDGSQVLWNFTTALPFTPFGDTESMMQVVQPGEDTGPVANLNPLAVLMGSDKLSKSGKVTGRDKGIIPTFFRPNPLIDIATKTGKVNELYRALGLASDSFGAPDAGEGWQQRQTAGLFPGASYWKELGARTGLTKLLRQQGIIKSDLDIEAPLNELLFGQNAGKPQSRIFQELTKMAQEGTITSDQAKLAIAAYKEGNWTPEALDALDRSEGENASRRLANMLGFSSVVVNTPRQVLANKLYQGMGNVYGQKGYYEIDPETGKKVYQKGAQAEFYDKNPGAEVLTATNDTPDKIRQGVADSQTFDARDKLYADLKAKKIGSKEFNRQMDILAAKNPGFFEKHPIDQQKAGYNEQLDEYKSIGGDRYDSLNKKYQDLMNQGRKTEAYKILDSKEYKQAKTAQQQYLDDHPDFKDQYDAYLKKTYGKGLTTSDEADYKDNLNRYQAIGGAKYDALSKMVSDYMDAGDKKSAGVILNSKEYKQAKAARDQYLEDNPEFAARYKAETEAKYGPTPAKKTTTGPYPSFSSYAGPAYRPGTSAKKSPVRSAGYSSKPKGTPTSYSSVYIPKNYTAPAKRTAASTGRIPMPAPRPISTKSTVKPPIYNTNSIGYSKPKKVSKANYSYFKPKKKKTLY